MSALVVLVGAAGAGKSTWCASHVAPHQIVSYDQLRQLVADDPGDQSATGDAVELGERLIAARLSRRRLTVVDATNTSTAHRADLLRLARRYRVTAHAVTFPTPADVCQRRNARRPTNRRVPDSVLLAQHAATTAALTSLPHEGFAGVHHACCHTTPTPCLLTTWKDPAMTNTTVSTTDLGAAACRATLRERDTDPLVVVHPGVGTWRTTAAELATDDQWTVRLVAGLHSIGVVAQGRISSATSGLDWLHSQFLTYPPEPGHILSPSFEAALRTAIDHAIAVVDADHTTHQQTAATS